MSTHNSSMGKYAATFADQSYELLRFSRELVYLRRLLYSLEAESPKRAVCCRGAPTSRRL